MNLISDDYRRLNAELHLRNHLFGAKGYQIADKVFEKFLKPYGIKNKPILDYGCGKGTLMSTLKEKYGINGTNYDPCVFEFSQHPDIKFDGVICSDVLEHIEPEMLSNVLRDLRECGKHLWYLRISLSPSNKTLQDGRNAHLIIETREWWTKKLREHGFCLIDIIETEQDAPNPMLKFFTGVFN